VPETFGKRQRGQVKQRKAAARDERRLARAQRREARAAGELEAHAPIAPAEPWDEALSERPRRAEAEPEGRAPA
jgi:hypothetical protein